jgi:hypothetical protein
MEKIHTKIFQGTPFIIESRLQENGKGICNSSKISIYRDDILIGEYIRNYDDYGISTFYPFSIGNDWYALYSAHYATTRVLKLHETHIEDWCGEDINSGESCPSEFFVPMYNKFTNAIGTYYIFDNEYDNYTEFVEAQNSEDFVSSEYSNFAFLSERVWGDDQTNKIRYINLSDISNKILEITGKFGYCPIPPNIKLKQAIHFNRWTPENNTIGLSKYESVNLDNDEVFFD